MSVVFEASGQRHRNTVTSSQFSLQLPLTTIHSSINCLLFSFVLQTTLLFQLRQIHHRRRRRLQPKHRHQYDRHMGTLSLGKMMRQSSSARSCAAISLMRLVPAEGDEGTGVIMVGLWLIAMRRL